MDPKGPWQLWVLVLGWPAVLAVLVCLLPRRWVGVMQVVALAGWSGVLGVLALSALRPPPPLWVWQPGGAGGDALAFVLRLDPLGLGLAVVCGALGLWVQTIGGEVDGRTRGALVPLLGMLVAFLGGNLFTYTVGMLLWEVSWAVVWVARKEDSWSSRGLPGGVVVLLILLLAAPAQATLSFDGEDWAGWTLGGAAWAGLWIAGVYPAVGWAEHTTALPKGMRVLLWTVQPALGLVLVGRVLALGGAPGWSALSALLLLCTLLVAVWAQEASLTRLAATRAALLALGICLAPNTTWALPWTVLGFGLGFFLMQESLCPGSRDGLVEATWARALSLLSLAGFPLTLAFSAYVAGASSGTFLWWLGLVNALSLGPYLWKGPFPIWRLSRPGWRESGTVVALLGLGVLALGLGPRPGLGGWVSALASALGGLAGALALAWLRRRVPLAERLASGAARAVDPLAWSRSTDRLGSWAEDGLRWALSLWEGQGALLWGMALMLLAALALSR